MSIHNSNIRSDLARLLKDLDDIDNIAAQLWTWLPSYALAEQVRGDYVFEDEPHTQDLINEAIVVIRSLLSDELPEDLKDEPWWDEYENGPEEAIKIIRRLRQRDGQRFTREQVAEALDKAVPYRLYGNDGGPFIGAVTLTTESRMKMKQAVLKQLDTADAD